MEITYYAEGKFLCVSFREWDYKNLKKYYFDGKCERHLVPELGSVPEECIFTMPVDIRESDFEDAILKLAGEINNKRDTNTVASATDAGHSIGFYPQPTTEDKLIDIIQKLVSK